MEENDGLTQVKKATESLQARLVELMAPVHFQELLELAEEVCLTHPPEYPETVDVSGEAAIVSQLGTRAIKSALELHLNMSYIPEEETKDNNDDDTLRQIRIDSPIKTPIDYSNGTDFNVLAKAEAFGAQIIKESFKILGQDAYKRADDFRNASDVEDQYKIIDWLNDRLRYISSHYINSDNQSIFTFDEDTTAEERAFFFHPMRLSPKLTGTFPNNSQAPTCLGVSIIATSFFKRAGADTLHADVTSRAIEYDRLGALSLFNSLDNELEPRLNIELPERIQNSLYGVEDQIIKGVFKPEAQHAAVYVRLSNEEWLQFDSNFYSTLLVERPSTIDELNMSYQMLTELSGTAPGLEIKQGHVEYSIGTLANRIFKAITPDQLSLLSERASANIPKESPESFAQHIFDTCIDPFFEASSDDEMLSDCLYIFKSAALVNGSGETIHLYDKTYHDLFSKYVLWGESPDVVVDRMAIDENYRKNRVADIVNLPFVILASVTARSLNHDGFQKLHSTIEVGLPEQRIGLAVLSDFAAYTNSPLPASFWASHWPGAVSVIENVDGSSLSNDEDNLIANNLEYLRNHSLTSARNNSIITKFFNARQPLKE